MRAGAPNGSQTVNTILSPCLLTATRSTKNRTDKLENYVINLPNRAFSIALFMNTVNTLVFFTSTCPCGAPSRFFTSLTRHMSTGVIFKVFGAFEWWAASTGASLFVSLSNTSAHAGASEWGRDVSGYKMLGYYI
jgi:hypothetical protein